MALVQGSTHTATLTPNGPVYSTPVWSVTPPGALTLTPGPITPPTLNTSGIATAPAVGPFTCALLVGSAATAFTLYVSFEADPSPGVNTITQSYSNTITPPEATQGGTTISVV